NDKEEKLGTENKENRGGKIQETEKTEAKSSPWLTQVTFGQSYNMVQTWHSLEGRKLNTTKPRSRLSH
ncbi:hypothetical protein PIB30_103771, partial [Stylosanthes scabra]|nr:hypothetical protein [Stylosanthes scabra]